MFLIYDQISYLKISMPTLLKLYKARYFDTLIEPIYSDLSIDKILRYQKHTTVIVHLVAEAPTQRCSVKKKRCS